MHFRIRDKKVFHSMIAFVLCLVMMLSSVPLSQIALAVPTAKDQEWINAVNGIITNLTTDSWTTYLSSKFYEEAPFDSGGSGSLNWSSVSLSATQKWDGTTASNPLPTVSGGQITFDGSTYTYNGNGYVSELKAQQAAAMADPGMVSPLDGSKYYVYSPQQLLYAFRTLNDASNKTYYTVEIMQDLDMNGMNYRWPTGVTLEDYTTINGNGCTIYNLGMLSPAYAYTAMISQCTALKATHLTFRNANICNQKTGVAHTAVFIARPFPGNHTDFANYWNLDSISFKDCMVVSRSGETGTLFGRFQCDSSVNTEATLQNCNVEDSLVTGLDHVGTLTGPILRFGTADKCFSVGCTNISYGKHSGGLFSCMGGMDRCSRCFVDAKVFGRSQTGVFTGNTDKVTRFFDCYSSGFIEGEDSLGGFNGSVNTSGTTVYYNCYSTALVGLRSAGSGLGGFFGRASNGAQAFVNCYAAGEVGSADTISTGATQNNANTSANGYIGGFAGQLRLPKDGSQPADNSVATVLAYCYYDKQTTAMREWDLGNYTLTIPTTRTSTSIPALSATALGINSGCQGLRGVLTTDTEKAGTGLTGTPDSNAVNGFTDFADLSSVYTANGIIDYAPGWNYTAANHYPELNCMANASAAEWGEEYYQLVQAYSKSSTSGPQLETWERGLNIQLGTKDGADLDETVYDTVRDLTMRFDLTTVGNQEWQRTETATGEAGTDKATVAIVGVTKDVLILNQPVAAGDLYYCDQFAPGIEWLETEVEVGEVVATRRFRVMPTAGVEAGPSQTIYRPSKFAPNAKKDAAYYDHADDVELYFSTAARMDAATQAGTIDITTGIYPDKGESGTDYSADHMTRDSNPLTPRQDALIPGSTSAAISSYFATHGNDSYGNSGSALPNTGLDVSFMARAQDAAVDAVWEENNADGSTLYIYVRDVSASIGADGAIDDNSPLVDMTNEDYAKTYNGQALKSNGDQILMFEYVWKLKDERLIYDAKLITVKATPFEVKISVFDAGGLDGTDANRAAVDTSKGLQDTNDALVGAQRLDGEKTDTEVAAELKTPTERSWAQVYSTVTDDAGNYLPDPKGGTNLLSVDDIGPEYGDASIVSWKVTNPEKVVTRLRLKLDSGREDSAGNDIYFEANIDDPKEGDDVVIPYEYYRVITSSSGSFYISIETLDIHYTVHYDSAKETYYLAFNHNETALAADHPGLIYDADVVDVANNIEVEVELSATLKVKKTVTGTLGDQLKLFAFTLTLVNDQVEGSPSYSYYIRHADGTSTEDTSYQINEGTAVTVNLRHGDTVVIPKLHYGATYTVAEASYNVDGYTTVDGSIGNTVSDRALTVTAVSPGEEGTHTADRLHVFVNSKNMSPPTGVILDIRAFLLLIALIIGVGCCFVGITLSKRRKRRRF